jgi:hypothetical protein
VHGLAGVRSQGVENVTAHASRACRDRSSDRDPPSLNVTKQLRFGSASKKCRGTILTC